MSNIIGEQIEGMTNRVFTDDGWELASAVKDNKFGDQLASFQEFWRNRCANTGYLSTSQVHNILRTFAIENFDKGDWHHYWHCLEMYVFQNGQKVNIIDFNVNAFFSAIQVMTMRYDNKGHQLNK